MVTTIENALGGCDWIMPDGRQCGQPVVSGKKSLIDNDNYCSFHWRIYYRRRD